MVLMKMAMLHLPMILLYIEQQLELPTVVSSPVEQGQVLGTVTYLLNGQEIGKVNIIAEKSVNKISTFTMIENIYSKWFSLLRN